MEKTFDDYLKASPSERRKMNMSEILGEERLAKTKEQMSLEEATSDFVWEVMEEDYDGPSELSKKLRPSSKISDYYDALAEFFKAGAKWQRQQMLKDAEECGLYWDGDFLAIDLNMAALGYSERDKVKVIVLKAEEE